MELVKVEVSAGKEILEVVDAVASLVEAFASGDNVFSAILGKLDKLNKAVENVTAVPAEIATAPIAVGILAQRILDALSKKP